MRILLIAVVGMFLTIGCAKVQVQAPKEPIKVDISMRLDVYQHVEKDIDEIENIVAGAAEKPQSRLDFGFFVKEVYAEGLSPEVEQAAIRRRDRKEQLDSLLSSGILGENKSGLVEIRKSGQADVSVEDIVKAENDDRMVIYKGIAEKNGTTVEEVQTMYAQRLQADAVSGTPIEAEGIWTIK